jgi:hypothetical protein
MRLILTSISLIVLAAGSLCAQEKIYPVRGKTLEVNTLVNADRTAFVVERGFQHKTTIGAPSDDMMDILPETRSPVIVMWLRVQNVSQRPLQVDISKFTSTDDQGHTVSALPRDEALKRMIVEVTGDSLGSKTLRRLSLGKAGKQQRTEEDVKEDIERYSFQSGEIPGGGVKEGMIYFEGSRRNKFTTNVTLGDLWTRPLLFSTEKQK